MRSDETEGVVRKLGTPDVPTYLERVRAPGGELHLIVVERLPRTDAVTDDDAAEYVRDAHTTVALEHPNVVRARAIAVQRHEISVACDFVDGEHLSELWRFASVTKAALSLETSLRILVDVLTGLGALHKIRDLRGPQRVRSFHGEVTAANVLVGLDGITRLLRACRIRVPGALPTRGLGTIAPEVLSGGSADQRADIYSVGALLWEALSGRPLFEHATADAILKHVQSGDVERAPEPTNAPWAAPLVDVAARAMAAAPDQRFPTAVSMVTELRRIAGSRLSTTVDVATLVKAIAGEKIASRRAHAELEPNPASSRAAMAPPPMSSDAVEPLNVQELSRAASSAAQNVFLRDDSVVAPTRSAWSDPIGTGPLPSVAPAVAGSPTRPAMTTESSLVVHTPEPMPAIRRGKRGRVVVAVCLAMVVLAAWWLLSQREDTTATTSASPALSSSASTAFATADVPSVANSVAAPAVSHKAKSPTRTVPASVTPIPNSKPPSRSKRRP